MIKWHRQLCISSSGLSQDWRFTYNLPSGYVNIAIEAMAIEIVSFPIENGDFP